jgi:hypothetical protein
VTPAKAAPFLACAAVGLFSASCAATYPEGGYDAPPPPPQAPPLDENASSYPGPYDQLVAPIALYPDPLVALILPAAVRPGDIAAAAEYLIRYGDPTQVDSQPWDPAVRALAHYPVVVSWMAQNIDWTRALGDAFAAAPAEVMEGVQRMRAKALAAGSLVSTPQQEVYQDGGDIEIYPAQPDVLYIPVYDDSVVYSDSPYYGYGGPFMNFGDPWPAGPWLSFYFDWRDHRVWSGDRGVWREHSGWRPPRPDRDRPPPGSRAWAPPPGGEGRHRPPPGAPAPSPRAGAPAPPPAHYRQPPPGVADRASPPMRQASQPGQRTAPPAGPRTPAPSRAPPEEGRQERSPPPTYGPAPAAEPGRLPPQEPRAAPREFVREAPARPAPPPAGQPAPRQPAPPPSYRQAPAPAAPAESRPAPDPAPEPQESTGKEPQR